MFRFSRSFRFRFRCPQADLPVRVYTGGLLIPLATPDFSMPYNVVTLTSTVIAMIFSSLFNTLLQREAGKPAGNAAPGEPAKRYASQRSSSLANILCSIHEGFRTSEGSLNGFP